MIPCKKTAGTSFESFYQEHIGIVQYVISRFRFPIQVQEELIQDVFVRFLECSESHEHSGAKSFLITISRNMAIDAYRKHRRRGFDRHVPVEDLPFELASEDEGQKQQQLRVVQEFLQEIKNDPKASTLVQYYEENLSIKDIAARSNESVATVSSRLSRQRQRYREQLQGKLEAESLALCVL